MNKKRGYILISLIIIGMVLTTLFLLRAMILQGYSNQTEYLVYRTQGYYMARSAYNWVNSENPVSTNAYTVATPINLGDNVFGKYYATTSTNNRRVCGGVILVPSKNISITVNIIIDETTKLPIDIDYVFPKVGHSL